MIPFFEDLWSKINNYFTTHMGSTRMEKIDNIDTSVSSRAPADTALSVTQWTNTRAEYLDKLDAGGIPGTVKSIQRGIGSQNDSAGVIIAISEINSSKAKVILDSVFQSTTSSNAIIITKYRITQVDDKSFVIVPIAPIGVSTVSYYGMFSWQVIEYY